MNGRRDATVLVVDDEDALRSHTRRYLERAGYTCDDAPDAAQARELLARRAYEVVLCDVRMPGESGLSLIQHITSTYPLTSTVMVSGVDDTDTAEQALQHGAVGYVVKPFERNELLINVANALHRRELELQNRENQARLEELVRQQADVDALTGLANRQHLTARLSEVLEAAGADDPVAVLFVDLDRLKVINDSLGHDAGDQVVREVAERLRRFADELALVGRFGGDKFVLAAVGADAAGAGALARELLDHLDEPHQVGDRTLVVSASVGIAITYGPSATAESALRDADAAMYQAKAIGRATFCVADELTRQRARQRLDTEHDLRAALEHDQLRVYYQPQFSLTSNELVGLEALVRWEHPELGTVLPDDFIPVAEETGLILQLGQWVLEHACNDLRRFRSEGQSIDDLGVAVNVSAVQLQRGALAAEAAAALERASLPAEALCLEITESILVEGSEVVSGILSGLKDLGVRLSIDDFGTGYSALGYISKLPVDELKIDRSFVAELGIAGGSALVEGIIGLARAMRRTVVAEGIETLEQLDELRRCGCDAAQGYLLGRPLPAAKLVEQLRNGPLVVPQQSHAAG